MEKEQTLKERMLSLRDKTDIKLSKDKYIMIMLDGRAFSTLIKKRFKTPFDDDFIFMMNETAKYLCENISGCKFAYVQSDEISLIVSCFENKKSEPFFDYRINKILSLTASMATAKFNRLWTQSILDFPCSDSDKNIIFNKLPLVTFDCKAWEIDNYYDVVDWLIYRQNDCVRNSINQTAYSVFSHKELEGLKTQERLVKLLGKGIHWGDFDDGVKYGRFIYKVKIVTEIPQLNETTERYAWHIRNAFKITENKERFNELNIIPKME